MEWVGGIRAADTVGMSAHPIPGPPRGRVHTLRSGLDLHFLDHGSGPPVVFVHGSGPGAGGHSNFKYNYPQLVAAGYRCLVPDLPGFGWSSKPTGVDYPLEMFADAVLELLDALEVRECALVGNSLGGAVSMAVALAAPERVTHLVLMGPGGLESREAYFAMPGIQKMIELVTRGPFEPSALRSVLEMLAFDPTLVTDELVAERFAIARTQPPEALTRIRVPDLTSRLGEIRCPILGFWGIDDRFCPPSGFAKIVSACAAARFVMLGRCGHWAMAEHPDVFNRYVIDFLGH